MSGNEPISASEIRTIRKALGLSYTKFAELLGYTSRNCGQTIYRFEKGTRRPSPLALKALNELREKINAKR